MNFYAETIQPDPRFLSCERIADVALLEPGIRAAVTAIMADAEAEGIPLLVFETFRSQARQIWLYNERKTKLRTVGVHHYGLACDLVKKGANGSPSWSGDFSFLGRLARKHGVVWGGDWGNDHVSHDFVDEDHVQRCSIADQNRLFNGLWYPDSAYDPYAQVETPPQS